MSDEELAVHDELLAAWKVAETAHDVPHRPVEDFERTRREFIRTGDEYESWCVSNTEWLVNEVRRLRKEVSRKRS